MHFHWTDTLGWTWHRTLSGLARSASPYVWANRWLAWGELLTESVYRLQGLFNHPAQLALWSLRVFSGFYALCLGIHCLKNPLWPHPFSQWVQWWGPHHPWFWVNDVLASVVAPYTVFWGHCLTVCLMFIGLSLILGLLVQPVLLSLFTITFIGFWVASPVDPILALWLLALMLPIPCLLGGRSQWVLGIDWWTAPYAELHQAGFLQDSGHQARRATPQRTAPTKNTQRLGPSPLRHGDELDNDPEEETPLLAYSHKPTPHNTPRASTMETEGFEEDDEDWDDAFLNDDEDEP